MWLQDIGGQGEKDRVKLLAMWFLMIPVKRTQIFKEGAWALKGGIVL